MAKEELFIGGVFIPLSKSLNASLTRAITDVENPQSRKATYSKTANIPNSKEAAEVFGSLFELNLVDSSFDASAKVDCRYVVDGEPVIEGYCQLDAINQKNRTDISYDIVMYSSLANIFRDFGEDYLTDLGSILEEWNHPFTKEIQEKSWETEVWNGDAGAFTPFAFGTGYVYGLMDYGLSTDLDNFTIYQLPCCLYLKEYIDAIFTYTGKTYTSNHFNSTYFKKHVIPSSPENFQLTAAEITAKQFVANTPQFTSTGTSTSNNFTLNTITSADTIIFTVESSDPSNQYNNATGEYTVGSVALQGTFDINALIDIQATFTPATGTAVKTVCEIDGYLMIFLNGTQIQAKPFYITSDDSSFISGARTTSASPTYPDGDYLAEKRFSVFPNVAQVDVVERTGDDVPNRYLITANNVTLFNGDVIEIKWKATLQGQKKFGGFSSTMFVDSIGGEYGGNANLTMSVGAFFPKVVNTYPAEGSTMKVDKLIPKNVKIKDFFNSIIKKHNLWIDIDPADSNNYIIEPRDEFLTTNIVNLDDKLDEGQDLVFNPMAKLDAAEFYFSDKEDKDYLNETYTAESNDRIYGDRTVLSTSEIVNGTKEVKTIFSPTVLAAPENSTRVLSTIMQKDDLGYHKPIDNNIRLLYYDGLKDGKAWNHINWTGGWPAIPFGETKVQYPYIGHFDDPYNATEDLNWGLVNKVYYDDNINPITITNNNLVNKYYSKQIQEYTSKESKIVTGMFNVTPNDFKNWSFRDLYWFRSGYFRLQKIEGYNPTGETLTKCVFLYLANTPTFSSGLIGLDGDDTGITPDGTGGGSVTFTEGTPTKGTKTASGTDSNNTGKRGVTVQGKYNYVAVDAYYVDIQGNSNQVWSEAQDIKIQGDNNIIDGGVKNVTLINTDGLTISESDVTYINGVKVDAGSISSPSEVSAISASQDVETTVKTYEVDTSGGDVTLTFELAIITYTEGQVWNFKKMSKNNKLIISVNGGTIDDQASQTIKKRYTSLSVQYNGTNFIII